MRSPPGSLLVLGQANIYHPEFSTYLRSDSDPWRIGRNLFDTLAPIGLVESAAVSMESDRAVHALYKTTKISVFTRNQRTAQRTICVLVQYTVY